MRYNPDASHPGTARHGAAMPSIGSAIAATLATIGAAVLSRLVAREWQRVNAELDALRAAAAGSHRDPRHDAAAGTRDLPTLRRDPVTGEYRPQWR